jgi:general secretion pathway protein N
MLSLAIGIAALALSSHCVLALNVNATDELSYDTRSVESPVESTIVEEPAVRGQAVETPRAPTQGRMPRGNPLWTIPFTALSATRERPIFSSSRRPRPPAVAVAPLVKPAAVAPKPKDPERPKLTLVGTITGSYEKVGIFLDQSTKAALRLKMGDDYQGWKLRSVQGREATLEKDQEAVILALPQPGDVAAPPTKAGILLSATTSSRRERSSH